MTTTLTPREIDAKLAEAIGLNLEWHDDLTDADGHALPPGFVWYDNFGLGVDLRDVPTFYSAPTWETSGQLIEGLTGPRTRWRIEIQWGGLPHGVIFFNDDDGWEATGDTLPRAIAEAARLVLHIAAPQ